MDDAIGGGALQATMTGFLNVPIYPQVSENKGHWDIVTWTTLKTKELKFELGKEFDETTLDGKFASLLAAKL